MKTYTTIIILLLAFAAPAQDTYYIYNKHWQTTRSREEYAYKRSVKEIGPGTYNVNDYYYAKGKYMTGKYITANPEYLADYRSTLYRQDTFTYYYPDSTVYMRGRFEKGRRVGIWQVYDSTGNEFGYEFKYDYSLANKPIVWYFDIIKLLYPGSAIDSSGNNNNVSMPEPRYDVYDYLSRNVKYPEDARQANAFGTVKIVFTIDTEGYITDVESISPDVHRSLQLEAIRVVQKMRQWKPGTQNDEPVKVYYTMPITFRL